MFNIFSMVPTPTPEGNPFGGLVGLSYTPQYLPVPKSPLQARLHLHITKLTDGEVQMFHCHRPLTEVVLQQQLSQLKAGENVLLAVPNTTRIC